MNAVAGTRRRPVKLTRLIMSCFFAIGDVVDPYVEITVPIKSVDRKVKFRFNTVQQDDIPLLRLDLKPLALG